MKTGRMIRSLMAMMLMCLLVAPAMAQKNIEKVVKELEGRSDVAINSVTKRDPKTRKIISMTKTYSVMDQRMVNALRKAFEKDEEFAITASKNLPKGRLDSSSMNLYFTFYPQENEKHTYSFSSSGNGQMTLTVIIKQEKANRDVSSMDFEFNPSEMQANLASVTQKVKDQLGCIVSENEGMDEKLHALNIKKEEINKKLHALNIKMKSARGRLREDGTLVLHGDVTYHGRKLGKGTHRIKGCKVIVN